MDSITRRVIEKHDERAGKGLEKYNSDMDRGDLKIIDWLNHLQEELMDATIYIEKLIQEREKNYERFYKVN